MLKIIEAATIVQAKFQELMQLIPGFKAEINLDRGKSKTAKDSFEIIFKNGSVLEVMAAKQSSRGRRATGGLIEEVILVPQVELQEVIIPTMNVDRRLTDGSRVESEMVNKSQIYVKQGGNLILVTTERLSDDITLNINPVFVYRLENKETGYALFGVSKYPIKTYLSLFYTAREILLFGYMDKLQRDILKEKERTFELTILAYSIDNDVKGAKEVALREMGKWDSKKIYNNKTNLVDGLFGGCPELPKTNPIKNIPKLPKHLSPRITEQTLIYAYTTMMYYQKEGYSPIAPRILRAFGVAVDNFRTKIKYYREYPSKMEETLGKEGKKREARMVLWFKREFAPFGFAIDIENYKKWKRDNDKYEFVLSEPHLFLLLICKERKLCSQKELCAHLKLPYEASIAIVQKTRRREAYKIEYNRYLKLSEDKKQKLSVLIEQFISENPSNFEETLLRRAQSAERQRRERIAKHSGKVNGKYNVIVTEGQLAAKLQKEEGSTTIPETEVPQQVSGEGNGGHP